MARPEVAPPPWLAGRTWYHVHALAALGAEPTNPDPHVAAPRAHRLPRLLDWLDHLVGLGVGGLLLTPVFASTTHGYDTVDPFRVDPRLGDADDLQRLIDACHARDLRVVLDGVLNHVGRDFPAFVDVLRARRASPSAEWFHVDFHRDGPDGFAYRTFEGHAQLVALNHASAAVQRWAADLTGHWLARGIDGWRFDAAYAVPAGFWRALCEPLRARFPDAFLFGEAIHGDYAAFVRASGLHAVTQYELHKAVWSALNDRNCFELSWALDRHAAFARTFVPVTFLGNHDVTRIASRLREPAHLGHALAVLCTVPGSPCVYYGDELAWRGVKERRAGGDDAIRPPLPATSTPASAEATAALALHRELLALRRARPWLTTAELRVTTLQNTHCEYVVWSGAHTLAVRLNAGATPATFAGPTGAWRPLAGAGTGAVPPNAWSIVEAG
jgi:glycosidase